MAEEIPASAPWWLRLGMQGGKWAVAGIFTASLGELIQFFWPDVPRFDSLTHFFFMVGAGLGLIGVFSRQKRATDLAVTVAAEAKIDRALLLGQAPRSADPAVQHELAKRQSNGEIPK